MPPLHLYVCLIFLYSMTVLTIDHVPGLIPQPLTDFSSVMQSINDSAWTSTIQSRHELAKQLTNFARKAPFTFRTHTALWLSINGHHAALFLPGELDDRCKMASKLLHLIITWNELTQTNYIHYTRISEAVRTLLHSEIFPPQETPDHEQPSNFSLNTLKYIYRALCYLFRDQEDAYFFYKLLYFEPYVFWVSHGTMDCIDIVGRGSTADVVLIQNDTHSFALKIFHPDDLIMHCESEQLLMHEIQDRLRKVQRYKSSDDNDSNPNSNSNYFKSKAIPIGQIGPIRVPRIYGEQCHNKHCIVMDYIEGRPLSELHLTRNEAQNVLKEISHLIVILGHVGIGHFDLSPTNILRDPFGHYWLVDFGMGVVFTPPPDGRIRISDCTEIQFPIIGTFTYISPPLIRLNALIVESRSKGVNVVNESITDLIIEANLWSLQAVTFERLLERDRVFYNRIQMYGRELGMVWRSHRELLSETMLCLCYRLWISFRQRVKQYNRRRFCCATEMFPLLDQQYPNLTTGVVDFEANVRAFMFDSPRTEGSCVVVR